MNSLNSYLNQSKCDCFHISVNSKVKRLTDILGAIVGVIITAIIFLPIAILITLDSPGPVLYRQTRCGLNGKTFTIWKFRSMVKHADSQKHLVKNQAQGHIFKNDQDPRVTRVGKFLRKTSLDEFPQFWNVLRGDMSLVGTRPPTPHEVENYNERHHLRLRVKPGLTGEWQVRGRSSISDFEEIVSLDLEYQAKWSIWYDWFLILKTIQIIFQCKGAY
jgi:exopolysaccharide biosynthesis polyprenyl glycosylphosphotransferase